MIQSLTFIFFSIFSVFSSLSYAAVTISANPTDGSANLRLEQPVLGLDNKKEIRIRINATGGQRYQVFQRLQSPLINERGESLNSLALLTASTVNSNTAGTLYIQSIDHLNMGDQLLYSSSQGGESDAFTIVYSVDPELLNASGNFSGKLVFTVRSDEGSNEQIAMDVFFKSTSKWQITVAGGHASDRVRINDTDITEKTADFVKVSFSGNSKEVRIYQEMNAPAQSTEGVQLDPQALMFYTAGSDSVRAQNVTTFESNRVLLYSGSKPEDNFIVYLLINPKMLEQQEPGTYNGKLKFVVETDTDRQEHFIDLECRIQPVFTVDVAGPPEGVYFPKLLPNSPPMEKEVKVSVRSNLHKPYQVTQSLLSLMVNDQGKEIRKEYFTLKVNLPVDAKGQTKFTDYLPAVPGDYPIFSSDSKGSPAEFVVVYRIQGYPEIEPGNYSSSIKISLNQN